MKQLHFGKDFQNKYSSYRALAQNSMQETENWQEQDQLDVGNSGLQADRSVGDEGAVAEGMRRFELAEVQTRALGSPLPQTHTQVRPAGV